MHLCLSQLLRVKSTKHSARVLTQMQSEFIKEVGALNPHLIPSHMCLEYVDALASISNRENWSCGTCHLYKQNQSPLVSKQSGNTLSSGVSYLFVFLFHKIHLLWFQALPHQTSALLPQMCYTDSWPLDSNPWEQGQWALSPLVPAQSCHYGEDVCV